MQKISVPLLDDDATYARRCALHWQLHVLDALLRLVEWSELRAARAEVVRELEGEMTLKHLILAALADAPRSRPELEEAAEERGYAPAGVCPTLAALVRAGQVRHVRRGGRHRTSLYAKGAP